MQLDLHPVEFDFTYGKSFQGELPEAYERRLLDAQRGYATFLMRSDELEVAWTFVTPILDAWQASPLSPIPSYPAGTWGPSEAERLIDARFGGWRRP